MAYMQQQLVYGLGLYPGDPCYDADRWSLLPYWIDDIQESECVSGTNSIFAAAGSYAGQQAGTAVGDIIGGAASGAVSAVEGAPTNSPPPASTPMYSTLLIGGAAVVATLLLLELVKK